MGNMDPIPQIKSKEQKAKEAEIEQTYAKNLNKVQQLVVQMMSEIKDLSELVLIADALARSAADVLAGYKENMANHDLSKEQQKQVDQIIMDRLQGYQQMLTPSQIEVFRKQLREMEAFQLDKTEGEA